MEITLKLDGWITIGRLQEGGLEELKLTYHDQPVKSATKISWRVINTGSKGISVFETLPFLVYPKTPRLDIAQARISEAPDLLKVDKDLLIDLESRTIKVREMGVFNEGESFRIDVHVLDIPESISLTDYLENWELRSKALDLKVKKIIAPEIPQEDRGFSIGMVLGLVSGVAASIAVVVYISVKLKLEPTINRLVQLVQNDKEDRMDQLQRERENEENRAKQLQRERENE